MKYIVLVADGMADYPLGELQERTPLEAARTPHMDFIARNGKVGRVKTIPEKMTPASDVANISILGYDPTMHYFGRGPLEAANLGITLDDHDVAFRCNLVTVSGDTLIDYSAGHISTKEATEIMLFVEKELGNERFRFYPGVSYRHLMVVKDGALQGLDALLCTPPHDILGKNITRYLPSGTNAKDIVDLMQRSRQFLPSHEINAVRIDLKENPANMLWFWGQGKKPSLPSFKDHYGLSGSVISAVDLIKGLGKLLGLNVISVPGATGYYDTDYEGKARAALGSLEHDDFVFIHVEAPDEAGHNGNLREKITSIERIDQLVLGTILEAYTHKENYRILLLADHPTPISLKTHTADPVPFVVFGKDVVGEGAHDFSEKEASKSALFFERGHELMGYFLKSVGTLS